MNNLPLQDIALLLSKVNDLSSTTFMQLRETLAAQKAEVLAAGDEPTAKYIWCLEQVLAIQELCLRAFAEMQTAQFYTAWCIFDQLDMTKEFLRRHFNADTNDEFGIEKISSLTAKFQALFPYRVFFSTEFIEKEKVCNICERKVAIRHPCGHTPGEIYRGELCLRIVTAVDLAGISMVETPRHKYAVAFLAGENPRQWVDQYDYSVIRYVVRHLRHPFDDWSFQQTTKRIPHEHFGIDASAQCPCGSSKTYDACCLPEDGVLMPHYEIYFASPVRDDLPLEVHLDPGLASKSFLERVEKVF
jgi:hypothetical protein